MTGRERVRAAMRFSPVDAVPLQYYLPPVGFYEHGEKLNDLFMSLPGDFGPMARQPVPVLPPSDFDAQGRYHTFQRDEWGTVWERRIFGVAGIACEHPLRDAGLIADYRFPPRPPIDEPALARDRAAAREHQKSHYLVMPGGSLYERMCALRPDEDVLCDIALDEPHIHLLADRIVEHFAHHVRRAVLLGADAISFGDDYGTERSLIVSPATWRSFFKPRLRALFQPAVDAGLDIIFHSCGAVGEILPDLREVGATAIWPQLPAYDMDKLAKTCRALGLAVAVHTDRARTMSFGTPAEVRALAEREYRAFRMDQGGAWFYVEPDNGFPFENIRALVETIAQWRG
ncbi:MAG: hypothetical protein GX558_12690 [Clostridiales bacterium]|nr:hypothetical protein [Clostridiales bacterium]